MHVRFYGRLADAIGREAEVAVPEASSVDDLREMLAINYPATSETLRRSRACIDGVVVDERQLLADEDAIEFLPPVCGG